MALRPEVREAIEGVLRERFDMVPITAVEVEEDEDHDGDPILRIRMVYDAEVEDLDLDRLVSITRHLRNRLWELGEERFPHTTFVTRADFEHDRSRPRRRDRKVAV